MQAQPPPPPVVFKATTSDEPLGEISFFSANVRRNNDNLAYNRIWISLVAGVATGIAGITGFRGFLVYLVAHAAMGVLLAAKLGFKPSKFFVLSSAPFTSNILAQQEILTFILFWTLTNNVVYLF